MLIAPINFHLVSQKITTINVIVNNFKNKMKAKSGRLFTLELRIRNKLIKLAVNQIDSFNDLFLRLKEKADLGQKSGQRVKEKLEAGLRSMAQSLACSQKIKNKLQELTQESKIVILGVSQSEKIEHALNETPFNILMQSTGNLRKRSVDLPKRNYLQDIQASPTLKRNYNNIPISQIIYQDEAQENNKLQLMRQYGKIVYNTTNSSPQPQHTYKRYGYQREQESDKNTITGFSKKIKNYQQNKFELASHQEKLNPAIYRSKNYQFKDSPQTFTFDSIREFQSSKNRALESAKMHHSQVTQLGRMYQPKIIRKQLSELQRDKFRVKILWKTIKPEQQKANAEREGENSVIQKSVKYDNVPYSNQSLIQSELGSFMVIFMMIDSEITDLLGDDPGIVLRFHELTPLEASLSPLLTPEEERLPERLFFDQESQVDEQVRQMVQGNAYDDAQAVRRPKRVSNTIFKTSLSEYRKSIIDEIKANPTLNWLRQKLVEVYGAKNMSVFPKLNFMVRQLQLQSQISKKWASRCEQLLTKKSELMLKDNYSEARYRKLEETIKSMNECINEKDFQVAFEKYWGKYRQEKKHERSKEDVDKFCKQFKKCVQQHQHRQHENKPSPISLPTTHKKGKTENLRRRKGSEAKDSSTQS